jgi:hypothetical protein
MAKRMTSLTEIIQEWQRMRREAYSSGRREALGFEMPNNRLLKRKVINKNRSPISRSQFGSNFRWKF